MIIYALDSEFARRLAQDVNVRVDDIGYIYLSKPQPEHSGSGQGKQAGPCYSQKQCDTANGYICAQSVDVNLPLSGTWGRFTCVAITATVQVAKTYKQCSRGRCLLEGDGTVSVQPDANSSSSQMEYTVYVNKTHANPPLANQTFENATVVPKGQSYHTPVNLTSLSSNASLESGMYAPQICPCNCTTFTFSCCFS